MRFKARKQWMQVRSLGAELLPPLAAALLVFAILMVLGPLTYAFTDTGLTGLNFASTTLGETVFAGTSWSI